MADKTELELAADTLLAAAEKRGIGIAKIKDGHIMVFTKAHLLGILGKIEASGSDKAIVFVKDHKTIN